MGLFGRAKLDAEQEHRLAVLERRLAEVEMEWNGWFDKFRRLYARIAKRVSEQSSEDAPGEANGEQPTQLQLVDPEAARIELQRQFTRSRMAR